MVVKRSFVGVMVLSMITFGLYGLVWLVATKHELEREGASIPTCWLLLVPLLNTYWLWRWCGGVDHFTRGRLNQGLAFGLMFLLSVVGMAIVQDELNKEIDRRQPMRLPQARVA